jgi:hypothetical protein
VGDRIEEGEGELLLTVEGGADPDSFLLAKAQGASGLSPYAAFDFGEPEADGDLLRVPFTLPLEEAGSPLALLQGEVAPAAFYACRGSGAD